MMIVHAIYLQKKMVMPHLIMIHMVSFKYKFYQIHIWICNISLSEFDDLSYSSFNGKLEFK